MPSDDKLGKRFTMRVETSMAEEIEAYLKISGMSMTEFVRRACREKLDRAAASGDEEAPAPLTREEVQKMIHEAIRGHSVTQTNTGDGAKQSVKIGK